MSGLDDLIKRLEAATEGSRDLDAEIWLGAHGAKLQPGYTLRQYRAMVHVPDVSTSLDAALQLVPEGALWGVGSEDEPGQLGFTAVVTKYSDADTLVWKYHEHATAVTPALVLCAAALKARNQ